MKENLSPEEKLLKLIRGGQKGAPQAHNPAEAPGAKQAVLQPAGTHPAKKKRPLILPDKFFTPVNLQKILWLIIAALLVYLIFTLIYPWIGLNEIKLPSVETAQKQAPRTAARKDEQPLEFYLQGMRDKPLFGSTSDGGVASIAAEAESIKDINLVGVILGDNPQAIIQDKKSEKTTYVSKGQLIGEYQVEEIKEGKVILNRNGQRFELSI